MIPLPRDHTPFRGRARPLLIEGDQGACDVFAAYRDSSPNTPVFALHPKGSKRRPVKAWLYATRFALEPRRVEADLFSEPSLA